MKSPMGRRTGQLTDPKRLLDLTLGSVLLILAAPALAGAALEAACARPAPGTPARLADRVFVRDYRVGRHGRLFVLRSLRTRRWRLDLLSRLPHVVRGDLSLVGPTPLEPGSRAASAAWRQLVRPGLTGLAQVRRYSPLPWNEPLLLDQDYVERYWLGLDLAVLARTLPALLLTPPATPPEARALNLPSPRALRMP